MINKGVMMKVKENDNVNVEKCANCKRRHFYKYSDQYECQHTCLGIRYIENCPCGDCLLKSICTEACDQLLEVQQILMER